MSDDRSSDIFTLRENVGRSDSLDSVSTYSNADVACYTATCRTGLNERNSGQVSLTSLNITQMISDSKVKVKVPRFNDVYTNEEYQRRGNWV